MRLKFLNLKQGDMTFIEYKTKFSALARFATPQLTDDNFKWARFEEGLKPSIQDKLAPLQWKSFANSLGIVLAIESKEL